MMKVAERRDNLLRLLFSLGTRDRIFGKFCESHI
jgi:hypothetical protein